MTAPRWYKRAKEPYPRCIPCKGKMIFPDLGVAEEAILRARIARALRGVKKRRETRAYACPHGPGFHITSWEAPGRPTTGDA